MAAPDVPPDVPPDARPARDAGVSRFIGVGLVNTAVSYVVFRGAFALLHSNPRAAGLAQVAAYAVAVANSFVLNRQWTFRSGGARGPEFARFVGSQLVMLALSTVAIQVAVGGLRLPATPSWVVTTGAVAVVNYLTLRRWVFRAADRSAPAQPARGAGGHGTFNR